jgi:hypothetical protein
MAERRDLRQQGGLDVLPRDEHVDSVEPAGERGIDEVLALDEEEPELVSPAALVQLADELELLVVARGDQVSC